MRKLALITVALCLIPLAALAQPGPDVDQHARLTALGGVTFDRPDWKAVREDPAVAVFEQAADPAAKQAFHVLLVAVEEGPPDAPDWNKIRDNIVEAASENERKLTLEVGDAYLVEGFEARLMTGTFESAAGQSVTLELVGLVGAGKLVTVSLISDEATEVSAGVLSAVARTVKLGG